MRTPPPARIRAFDGEHFHQIVVGSAAHRGIQIDHLNLRKRGKFAQHFIRAVAFEGFLAALHELDDFAIHQIDTRNNH